MTESTRLKWRSFLQFFNARQHIYATARISYRNCVRISVRTSVRHDQVLIQA